MSRRNTSSSSPWLAGVVTALVVVLGGCGNGSSSPDGVRSSPPPTTVSATPSATPELSFSSRRFPDCKALTAGYAAAVYERAGPRSNPPNVKEVASKSHLTCVMEKARYRGFPGGGSTRFDLVRLNSAEDFTISRTPEEWLRDQADEVFSRLCDEPQPLPGGNFDYAMQCYLSVPRERQAVATVALIADGVMAGAQVSVEHSGQPDAAVREFTTALALTATKTALGMA